MQSWLDGEPRSYRGVGIEADGHVTTASLGTVVLPASFQSSSLEAGDGVVATSRRPSECLSWPTTPPSSTVRVASPWRGTWASASPGKDDAVQLRQPASVGLRNEALILILCFILLESLYSRPVIRWPQASSCSPVPDEHAEMRSSTRAAESVQPSSCGSTSGPAQLPHR